MEQATDAEKAMVVSEFLDFKRRNKVHFHFTGYKLRHLIGVLWILLLILNF